MASGRSIRVLSIVDAYTRACLALEVDTSFASPRVTRVLENIAAERGWPRSLRCPAFFGLVRGTPDRDALHATGPAHAEWPD